MIYVTEYRDEKHQVSFLFPPQKVRLSTVYLRIVHKLTGEGLVDNIMSTHDSMKRCGRCRRLRPASLFVRPDRSGGSQEWASCNECSTQQKGRPPSVRPGPQLKQTCASCEAGRAPLEETKVCTRCRTTQKISQFNTDAQGVHRSTCRGCSDARKNPGTPVQRRPTCKTCGSEMGPSTVNDSDEDTDADADSVDLNAPDADVDTDVIPVAHDSDANDGTGDIDVDDDSDEISIGADDSAADGMDEGQGEESGTTSSDVIT